MEVQQKEPVTDLLELISRMKYFTKLKLENGKENSFHANLKVSSYTELNEMISSLLKTSITILKNNPSETGSDAMLLLEIALQLLPSDEMELLDELSKF